MEGKWVLPCPTDSGSACSLPSQPKEEPGLLSLGPGTETKPGPIFLALSPDGWKALKGWGCLLPHITLSELTNADH